MIWQIYTVSTNSTIKSSLQLAQDNLINTICVLIGFNTHGITFYIYLLASSTLRKNVQEMFLRSRRIAPSRNVDLVQIIITKPDQRETVRIH
ncbi:unnamed protein product [Rotaria magnacalcarata]|uniref:Uncharacterized protein n=1 Tax=Rotaria magnacalcarata TaxID=392030 RepID=A0A820QE55_9BILA|nr:unnamed protein product [Rotaria magnacalcarata]